MVCTKSVMLLYKHRMTQRSFIFRHSYWRQIYTSIWGFHISRVCRFNYLKRYLGGQALETISGLSLSSANYKEAVRILIERYGNAQGLIFAHMDCLICMSKVTQKNDIKNLRKLYNGVENCTRNLSALDLDVSAYGSLLIPIFKGKLPDDLNMTIARRFGSEIWSLARWPFNIIFMEQGWLW